MIIDAHIAAWALKKLRADPRSNLGLLACEQKLHHVSKVNPPERILSAEPISGVIGLTLLLETIGFGAASGAIGGIIVGTAISFGLSLAARALQPKLKSLTPTDASSNGPESRYSTRQSAPPKRIIVGSAQVGGALFFEQVKAPYLYHGLLINDGRVTAFRRIWIGLTEIIFGSLIEGSILTPLSPVTPNYPGRLQISLRHGTTTQVIDPLLAAGFPSLDAQFRQRGIATVTSRYHFGIDQDEFTALWGQVARPNILFLVDGVRIPDPRISSHVLDWDPDSIASYEAAEASWTWTNNASRIQAWYLTQRSGGRVDPASVNWDKVRFAADYDDGLVGCKDGTFIKRHTIDGVITLDQRPYDVMQDLLTANRGFVLESAGRVWVSSSRPLTPIATIHDGVLAGAIRVDGARAKRDLINRVKSQFIASEREYQAVDGPVLDRPDLQAQDRELLEGTLSFPFTLDHRRVQRLQKASLGTSRLGKAISCLVDVSVLADADDELVGNVVMVSSELFPQANGLYRILSVGFSATFSTLELALFQYDATIESDWSPPNDEKDFVLAPLDVS